MQVFCRISSDWTHPISSQWDHRPEPLFDPERCAFARRQAPGADGDDSTDWSIFREGSFDPGAPRSRLLRRLRRSVFRPHPPKPGFGPFTAQSSTVVAHHERES